MSGRGEEKIEAGRRLISGGWKSSEEVLLETSKNATELHSGRTTENIACRNLNIENEFMDLAKSVR